MKKIIIMWLFLISMFYLTTNTYAEICMEGPVGCSYTLNNKKPRIITVVWTTPGNHVCEFLTNIPNLPPTPPPANYMLTDNPAFFSTVQVVNPVTQFVYYMGGNPLAPQYVSFQLVNTVSQTNTTVNIICI